MHPTLPFAGPASLRPVTMIWNIHAPGVVPASLASVSTPEHLSQFLSLVSKVRNTQAAKDEEDISLRDKAASPEPERKCHFILFFRYVATYSLSHRTEHMVTLCHNNRTVFLEIFFLSVPKGLGQYWVL